MANKIFVGNLSWNIDDDSLAEEFGRYGDIRDAKVVTDRETGKSRGFGFVTFDENQSAQDVANETTLDANAIYAVKHRVLKYLREEVETILKNE